MDDHIPDFTYIYWGLLGFWSPMKDQTRGRALQGDPWGSKVTATFRIGYIFPPPSLYMQRCP